MKKKLLLVFACCAVAVSLFVGGVVFANGWTWIELEDHGSVGFDKIDTATINVRSTVFDSMTRSHTHVVKPEYLVESVTDADGNSVDFSELEISYGTYFDDYDATPRQWVVKDLSKDEALKEDGTLNIEAYEIMLVTFSYTYTAGDYSNPLITSTVKKTVIVENAGY